MTGCTWTAIIAHPQDMVIFMGLLNDLFPGVDPPRKRDLEFEKVIAETTAEMKLTREDNFILRVVQLSELLAIRHCVFLMGPTGSGRTEVYKASLWNGRCLHMLQDACQAIVPAVIVCPSGSCMAGFLLLPRNH